MNYDISVLNSIANRALYCATHMIYLANNRNDVAKGDPKIGGHPAASSSALHILGALHLVVKSGFDFMAVKPHASPTDHSYNYLLNLLLDKNKKPLGLDEAKKAMHNLRAFSTTEYVFQSYHSKYDPDHTGFLPSGTVGIPPVNLGYLSLAYKFLQASNFKVPKDAHFWALIGDSEFREGSLLEAMPDFAERQLGNITWIIDYNRQSLDGHRLVNQKTYQGNDFDRIFNTSISNGWECIQLQHGSFRKKLFNLDGGKHFKKLLEKELSDFELQALLLTKDAKNIRKEIERKNKNIKLFLDKVSDKDLIKALNDFGGHDFGEIIQSLNKSKLNQKKPTLIIAHTIKGWGLKSKAICSNHNILPSDEEVQELMKTQKIHQPFELFKTGSKEARFLSDRHKTLLNDFNEMSKFKTQNKTEFDNIPNSLNINLKLVVFPHTQWMFGQLISKLTRIANSNISGDEKFFKPLAKILAVMSPDVGTSTNLNPSMDGKVYGNFEENDLETDLNVRDPKSPHLVPDVKQSNRFFRFEITEANSMSCVGSFGKIKDLLSVPVIPIMTIYDFFIKRALDQYFYNLYWDSNFILVGTPSGITLSPEGAQHGWKSDFQIPNQITWEPFFCQELDWIFVDAIKRHVSGDNKSRTGVLIRATTRGVDQKDFLKYLKKQTKFKVTNELLSMEKDKSIKHESLVENIQDNEILNKIRLDILKGGYNLINYFNYDSYDPGDNVINILSMGSPSTEAIKASEILLDSGIYANVIVVTSPDLLLGNLGQKDGYLHLHNILEKDSPIITVHDGEPGLLDNAGSVMGVKAVTLATRKHSKCGRPNDIYKYHKIDSESIASCALEII